MHRTVTFLTGYGEEPQPVDSACCQSVAADRKSGTNRRVGLARRLRAFGMARISVRRSTERTRITISGRLTAADMGRLEHACGAALTVETMPQDIDVSRVTAMDKNGRRRPAAVR
jgi:ribosomal protein S3